MWVVQLVLLLILLSAIFVISTLNGGRTVDLISLGWADYANVPLNLIIVQSALFGALWALLIFFFIQVSTRLKMLKLKRLNAKLREELDTLRILPLDDLPIDCEEK